MKKTEKIFEVDNLKAKIGAAKSIALADYKGITVAQITALREKIKEAGGELQVVKNTLFSRALSESGYKEIDKNKFFGPSLALFANADEIAPLKTLAAFAKGISLLPFKIGFLAGKILSADELSKFATLPPKIDLQAKLVGMLASQPRRLAYSLNYNLQKLVLVLNQVKNKKQ